MNLSTSLPSAGTLLPYENGPATPRAAASYWVTNLDGGWLVWEDGGGEFGRGQRSRPCMAFCNSRR